MQSLAPAGDVLSVGELRIVLKERVLGWLIAMLQKQNQIHC